MRFFAFVGSLARAVLAFFVHLHARCAVLVQVLQQIKYTLQQWSQLDEKSVEVNAPALPYGVGHYPSPPISRSQTQKVQEEISCVTNFVTQLDFYFGQVNVPPRRHCRARYQPPCVLTNKCACV